MWVSCGSGIYNKLMKKFLLIFLLICFCNNVEEITYNQESSTTVLLQNATTTTRLIISTTTIVPTEQEINFSITGFYETDLERKLREENPYYCISWTDGAKEVFSWAKVMESRLWDINYEIRKLIIRGNEDEEKARQLINNLNIQILTFDKYKTKLNNLSPTIENEEANLKLEKTYDALERQFSSTLNYALTESDDEVLKYDQARIFFDNSSVMFENNIVECKN